MDPRLKSTSGGCSQAIERDGVADDQQQLGFINLFRVHFHVLSVEERHVLRHIEIQQRSYSDVANRLGTTAEVVKQRVFDARRKVYLAMAPTLGETT